MNNYNCKKQIIIEILKDSFAKLQYKTNKADLVYDRPLKLKMPVHYGTFMDSKIQGDGDLLDIILLTKKPVSLAQKISVTELVPLALIDFNDCGQEDYKVVYTYADQYSAELLPEWVYEIENYVTYLHHYKAPNECYVRKILFDQQIENYGAKLRAPVNKVEYIFCNLKEPLYNLIF